MRVAPWILVFAVLASGCSSSHESSGPSPTNGTSTEASSSGGPRAASKPAAQPSEKTTKPKPSRANRALPWQANGLSRVVHVQVRQVAIYKRPSAKRALFVLRKKDPRGTQRAFLVRATTKKWVRVYLPTRPNGSQGWVRARAVKMYTNGYRLIVRLRAHKLFVWRGTKRIAAFPVATGTSYTPTPRGLFYVVELLKPHNADGSYGPYAFGLSAHSERLKTFAGGDGRVGLHGTNQPGLIGSSVSHGCIRLRNADIRRLAKLLPLGTPVYVRS